MKAEVIKKFEDLKNKEVVKILAIESSCDETSIAIVENGRKVISCKIATQIEIHKRFGGVVPEVASRNHITAISNVLDECLADAKLELKDIDAIAVTYGAGLIGALLVGVNFAKGLAYALDLPLIAVSHIMGHISANYLENDSLYPPFLTLLTSGGHTALVEVKNYNELNLLGSTVDDAVGEAFDKVARTIGLSYPGGVEIDKLASLGVPNIAFLHKHILENSFDFSFSGIKTAVINYVHNMEQKGEEINKADIACSFQKQVVDELVNKTIKAIKTYDYKTLVVAGGVGANSLLRTTLCKECEKLGVSLHLPKLVYCTDNAAMIGSAAYYLLKDGKGLADYSLTASSVVKIGQ